MAFYGSSVANLCPILFKGNLFSEGVNIIFHSDISYSMNLSGSGDADYNSPRTNQYSGTNIGAGSTVTMFYDGIFPAFLHSDLLFKKVGLLDSPNLYSYVDQTLRRKSFKQSITGSGSELLEFDEYMILGDANFDQFYKFKNTWSNDYIDVDQGSYTPNAVTPTRFQQLYRTADAPINVNNRVNNLESNVDLPGIYSEDVHGTIWSLYYSNNTQGTTNITEGRVNTSRFGKYLNSFERRKIPTYLITASNEQENCSPSVINGGVGIAISTKNFVGYTTSKYTFTQPGFFFRRYRGYFEGDLNTNASSGGPLPGFSQGVNITGGNDFNQERFKEFFNDLAQPLPLGIDPTGDVRDAPGCNWYINGNEEGDFGFPGDILGNTDLGGTEVVDRTVFADDDVGVTGYANPVNPFDIPNSGYGDISLPNSPNRYNRYANTTNTNKGAFWGPVTSIDRFRSDIQGYSAMAIGYFQPLNDGIYRFRLQSVGASFLWIAGDDDSVPAGTGQIDNNLVSEVYNNWDSTTANILCPTNSQVRYQIREADSGSNQALRRQVNTAESITDRYMTGGRFYPFRVIMGNPAIGSGNPEFPLDGDLEFGSGNDNPSVLRMLFTRPDDPTKTWQLSGDGFFFGGSQVWEEGSPFFPPPIQQVQRTIQEELRYRDVRVIGISNYESDIIPSTGIKYDGVFVNSLSPASYRYINLDRHEYSEISLAVSPETTAGGLWRFGSHFKPISYGVQFDSSLVTQYQNTQRNPPSENTVSAGASFTVNKLNDRYLIEVVPGYEGTGFRVGDTLNIDASLLGETSQESTLVVRIDELQEETYTNRDAANFNYGGVVNASVEVQKGGGVYSYNITNGGSGFEVDSLVRVKGNLLDGIAGVPGSPNNDLVIKILAVDGNGSITDSELDGSTGTPTNYIDYEDVLDTFNPKIMTLSYDNVFPISSEYRNGRSVGIAYTHVNITSIGFTNTSITGIAYSFYPITGVAYTAIDETNNVGIAYSSVAITGIAYTTNEVVGAAYTNGDITGIAYTTASISAIGHTYGSVTNIQYEQESIVSVGHTSTSVTSIGYTAPNITSIGYTVFGVNSIVYPDAFGIDSYESISNGGVIEITTVVPVIDTLTDSVCDITIIGLGAGIDGDVTTTTVISANTFRINGPGGLGNFGPVSVDPDEVKLIVRDSGPGTGNVAIGTAVLATDTEHGFDAGDRLIIRGIADPFYSSWNSTVVAVGASANAGTSLTSFYIDDSLTNTALAGFFTGTSVGSGATVGYETANLELEIAATFKSVGITSIAYDLGIPSGESNTPYRVASNARISGTGGFDGFRRTGSNTPTSEEYEICIESQNFGLTLSDYLDIGDIVYFFETQSVFDYNNIGYGLTVTDVNGGLPDSFRFDVALGIGPGSDFTTAQNGYYIINKLSPIVNASSHGFANGELVKISNNENSIYNDGPSGDGSGIWQVSNSTTDTFTLADPNTGITSTSADLITNSGNTLNLSGIASASSTEYKFEVGMGITVFGVTGESAIYNDGYVIAGIKSAITDPYAFILKENQTPTELALKGTSGKIGIHTISGIATVTNTSNFGDPGDVVQLKIQDAPATFFNQTYASAKILDATRFLLGTESERDLNTPNPEEYSSSSNTDGSTIGGLVGNNLEVVIDTANPNLTTGADIDIVGTTNFDDTYTIVDTKNSDLTLVLNRVSTGATDFSLNEGSGGEANARDLGPQVTVDKSLFPDPFFGGVGDSVNIKLQNTDKTNLNDLSISGTIETDNATEVVLRLTSANSHNPLDNGDDYTAQTTTTGTAGLIGGNLFVFYSSLTGSYELEVADSIDVYSTTNWNDLNYPVLTVGTYGPDKFAELDRVSTGATDFTLTETTGGFGVRDLNPIVTFSNSDTILFRNPLFGSTGTSVNLKIQNTSKSNVNGNYTGVNAAKLVSDTSALLGGTAATNPIDAGSDYSSVGAGGTVGLIGSRLAIRLSTPILYNVGDQLGIQNVPNQFGETFILNDLTIITEIINNTNPYVLTGNDVSNSGTDFGIVGTNLPTAGGTILVEDAIVTAPGHPFVTGDEIKIQDVVGNGGLFDYNTVPAVQPYQVTVIDSNTFSLNASSSPAYVNDFTDANGGAGTAGLINYPATVTSINHPFVSGQTVKIENNPLFNGSYIINVLDANRFRLNVNAGLNTDFTSPLNAGDNVYIALRNEGVTVSYNKQNAEYGGSGITSPINVGDQVRLQGTDNVDGVYDVTWSKQTFPYEFGIEPTEPAVFDGFDQDTTAGTAGLSDSRLRVRANNHNLTNGQNITIQNSSPTDFDGNYTVQVINANFIELTNSTQSTSVTDYTQISTSGILGYPGYPATAELSETSLPIGIEDGVQLRIVGNNQPFAPSGSTIQNVNIKVYRNDGINPVRLGLTNVTSSTQLYDVTYDNAGFGYTGGLRNVEPIITFTTAEGGKLGLNNPSFQVGNIVPLDIISTVDFASGFYDSILLPGTNPYTLQLINAQNPSNDIFVVNDNFFRVGLANSDRIISSPSHGFTSADINQGAAIFINTGDPLNQGFFGGNYYVSEILDSDTFAVRNYPSNSSTALPSGSDDDYTVGDVDGYYVGFGTGVRLNCNNNFFNNNHALNVGQTLTISGTANYNGSYTVVERISNTDVRLNGPYPSPVNDGDGFDDYTQTESGTFLPTPGVGQRICPFAIRRFEDRYSILRLGSAPDGSFRGFNYKVDEQFVISGADLNGDAVNNRFLIRISSILAGGGVNGVTIRTPGTIGNTPDPALDYNPTTFALSQASGDGINATFNITRKGEYDSTLGITTYSEVTVNNAGQFYQVNESLIIQGTELGGESPDNDLIITIEKVTAGGAIDDNPVGTGFTFVGESVDGSPLKTVGITTLYVQPNNPANTVSKPIGLEETWRRDGSLNFTEPPAGQGELKQTHDMITLAKANKGGVIKSSRVFQYGDIAKQAEIFEIFAYGYRGEAANTNTFGESNIIYDTNGNSGIATINLVCDEAGDEQMMQGIRPGDTVYILSRLEPAVQNNSDRFPGQTIIRETFTDYTVVGYGFTVIGIYSESGNGFADFNEPSGRNQTFSTVIRSFGNTFYNGPITGEGATEQGPLGSGYQNPDDGLYYSFAFGTGFDQLVIQTANKNATLNDNISDDISFIIVRGEEPILVRTNGIHPFVPGERIYIENTKLFDRNTLISPNINPGLAGTSFIMSPTNTDVGDKGQTTSNAAGDRVIVDGTTTNFSAGEGYRTFQIQDDSGNPITMNSISPTGETYFELFMKNCSGMRLGEGAMSFFEVDNLNQSWEDGLGDWSRLNYPVVYGTRGVNGENPQPGGDSDRVATRFILAQGGLAYTLVPGGAPRVDNRIGLAKAVAKFISDNIKGETT